MRANNCLGPPSWLCCEAQRIFGAGLLHLRRRCSCTLHPGRPDPQCWIGLSLARDGPTAATGVNSSLQLQFLPGRHEEFTSMDAWLCAKNAQNLAHQWMLGHARIFIIILF
jgi:hypothetical protein